VLCPDCKTWLNGHQETGHDEARHSAASLARDSAVDPEIRRKTLGHSDQAMTSHYTHIEPEAHLAAAEAVARLVEGAGA
jgi:integrase